MSSHGHPLTGTGYAGQRVTKVPDWHLLVAWDLLFNNLSTGLFLTAALGDLLLPEVFASVAQRAYPLALVLLVVDLVALVADLGDPRRFHHMLRVFKPTSPMSLGTWCLSVYSLPLTVAAACSVMPVDGATLEWARKAAVVIGLLPALGSATYKGVLLSTNAQPGWRDARWLGGYLTNSALLLGCAELMALSIMIEQHEAIELLRYALSLLLVLNALTLLLLLLNVRNSLAQIYTASARWRLGLLTIGAGLLAPLCLAVLGRAPLLLWSAVSLLLLGSLVIRLHIIKFPHAISRD